MADESRAKPTAGPFEDLSLYDLSRSMGRKIRELEELLNGGADKPRVPPPFNPATAGGKWPDGEFEGDAAEPPTETLLDRRDEQDRKARDTEAGREDPEGGAGGEE